MPNFTPSANTYAPAGVPVPFNVIDPIQTLSADGAITLESGVIVITKGSAAAITLAVPDRDGQRLTIVSESAFAHTITTVSPGFNGSASFLTITMSTTVGDRVMLESQGGTWYVVVPSQHANAYQSIQVLSGDGAITIKNGLVIITKGTAAAITIANPTTGVDDGAELQVISTTAAAHVITQGTSGFNGKGASGTATFGAAKGNAVELVAYAANWYAPANTGVTIA